jgi:hypothetical protein
MAITEARKQWLKRYHEARKRLIREHKHAWTHAKIRHLARVQADMGR